MLSAATPLEPPLLLYEVLEEEYSALHGELPPAYLQAKRAIEGEYARKEDRNEPLIAALYQQMHRHKRSALCLSGGGIRSATFALGAMQGLARHGLLDKFHYLSTVSGGGYIGSWLTAWAYRCGLASIIQALRSPPQSKLAPEPAPLHYLRNYSNYLTPKLGMLSADTWTLVATVLRNLLLNWLVLIPLIVAVLMIPRVCVPTVLWDAARAYKLITLVSGSVCLGIAVLFIGLNRPSAANCRQDQGSFLRWCLVPLALATVLLTTYWAWERLQWSNYDWRLFVLFGMVINCLGFIGGVLYRPSSFQPTIIYETLAVLCIGALGGYFVWLTAAWALPGLQHLFPSLPREALVPFYVSFAAPLLLLLFLVSETLFVGVVSYWTDDEDREWWARAGAWILIAIVGWSVFSTLTFFGPPALLYLWPKWPKLIASVGGVSGLITILTGFSGKTPAHGQKGEQASLLARVLQKAHVLIALIFAAFLLVLLSLGAELVLHRSLLYTPAEYLQHIYSTSFGELFVLIIVLAALGLIMGCFVNINRFSLHAMYRNRLIRAYLGASRPNRDPNPFTGFDGQDNLYMHTLWPNSPPQDGLRPPFHVVNMALNLVHGESLAWQQRKAASFTSTPLHSGNGGLGYRRSKDYGGKRGITLGTAVAISGAAASPNMGYHSSPVITFLMTLFNARLGWWLGNTGAAGARYFRYEGPYFAPRPLVAEAFGLTNDTNPYVYLSDGGHFENLGLYEMVLRRCHCIVVSDASCDPEYWFEDLGSAVSKIRIDLGVPIEFEELHLHSRLPAETQATDPQGKYCALGRIRYSCVDQDSTDGVLIYLKPGLCGEETRDVLAYAKDHAEFPHETTADQWFSESQFESYRALGSHAIDQIVMHEAWQAHSLEAFVKQVYTYLHGEQPLPDWLQAALNPVIGAQGQAR